jgi:Bax protein
MKYLYIALFLTVSLFASEPKKQEFISVSEKKQRFYTLIVPVVKKVYKELDQQYKEVFLDIQSEQNFKKIKNLKDIYRVKTDKGLLLALKPHQPSITLAQAAMESSWATSRFFTQANNIFGMWSVNSKEPKIAALQKRKGVKTIWLKKFKTVEESVREYYKLMARARAYKEFRKVRNESNNVFEIIKELNNYSELGAKYTEELASIIKYNKLTRYD